MGIVVPPEYFPPHHPPGRYRPGGDARQRDTAGRGLDLPPVFIPLPALVFRPSAAEHQARPLVSASGTAATRAAASGCTRYARPTLASRSLPMISSAPYRFRCAAIAGPLPATASLTLAVDPVQGIRSIWFPTPRSNPKPFADIEFGMGISRQLPIVPLLVDSASLQISSGHSRTASGYARGNVCRSIFSDGCS